mmetsp:Transcript_22809/g.41007  ORF Transcript_22809/g.41007 Transcript_22809/m.41007 type:complete len:510 (-) Transcript_22809:28-1557(-)
MMRKQPKRTATKLSTVESEQPAADEEQKDQPEKKKKHHRKSKAERTVNKLNISNYEASLKSNTEVQKEKIELGIDLEQRKKAFTASGGDSKPQVQREEIVAGMSVKDRVANLYGDKKETEARKVEVPSDIPSVRQRAATYMTTNKEKEVRKVEALVEMSLEERKAALFNRAPSGVEAKKEIVVERDLKSRMHAFQSSQPKAVERTFKDEFSGPSLQERMAAFNKTESTGKSAEKPVIEPAMSLAERKRMLQEAHSSKKHVHAERNVGSVRGLASKYEERSSGSGDESGSYSDSEENHSSEDETPYYYGDPDAQPDEADESSEDEAEAKQDLKEEAKIEVEIEAPKVVEIKADLHEAKVAVIATALVVEEPKIDPQNVPVAQEIPKEALPAVEVHKDALNEQEAVVQVRAEEAVHVAPAEEAKKVEQPKVLNKVGGVAAELELKLKKPHDHIVEVKPAHHQVEAAEDVAVPPMPKRAPKARQHFVDSVEVTGERIDELVQEIEHRAAFNP